MGYYKVPQDVEAEDKLLGPFTFKQFLFLIGLVISAFVTFQIAATINIFAAIPFLPIVFVCAIVALYHPKDQPVENKVLAYINFTFRPRKRVWSRDGIVEQVHIKVPKRIDPHLSDGRSQLEVRNQLKQLAQIVDTRGWSSKRADVQEPFAAGINNDDRLIQTSDITTVYDDVSDISAADDIYDGASNPVAQAFGQQTTTSEEQARAELIERLRTEVAEESNEGKPEEPERSQTTYVNPYSNSQPENNRQQDEADAKELKQRIKELEKNQELPISSIAERAQEMHIDHQNESNELTIQH